MIFIYLFKTANIMFLSYIFFELLDVEHGSPISHKSVKRNSLSFALAVDPLPPPLIDLIYKAAIQIK